MGGAATVEEDRGTSGEDATLVDGGDATGPHPAIATNAAIAADSTAPLERLAGVGAMNVDPSTVALPSWWCGRTDPRRGRLTTE
jgi:hypothetical protein